MRLNRKKILGMMERGLLILAALALLKFLLIYNEIGSASTAAADFLKSRESVNSKAVAVTLDESGPITKQIEATNDKTINNNFLIKNASVPSDNSHTDISKSAPEQQFSEGLIAVINIDSIGIQTPLYKGTKSKTLDIGAGLIEGTSTFDNPIGNVGIAAHRDSYFRALKDIKLGDKIRVSTPENNLVYQVSNEQIVLPTNTRVLYPDGTPKLTLVTCYPFYFVGNAPKRFIVTAELIESTSVAN